MIRRLVLPMYIPIISLICSFLLFKKNNFFSNRLLIFLYSFILLIFLELIIKYTGMNNILKSLYIILPIILLVTIYPILNYKSSR